MSEFINFTFDYLKQEWVPFVEERFIRPYIPYSTEKKKAWCSTHKQWESCGKTPSGKIFFSCGRPVDSQFILHNQWSITSFERSNSYELQRTKLRANLAFTTITEDGTKKIREEYKEWCFNMNTGETNIHVSSEILKNLNIDIPKIVFTEIQSTLYGDVQDLYNREYINTSRKSGIESLIEFTAFPVWPQLAILKKNSTKEFEIIVKHESRNPYKDIFNYFHIKPTKNLRKVFVDNPLTIPVYMLLKRWGFKNEDNIISFLKDKYILDTYFKDIGYVYRNGRFVIDYSKSKKNSNDDVTIIKILKKWCRESLKIQSEEDCMKNMIKAMKENYSSFYEAGTDYYKDYFVSELKERVLKECFLKQIQDENEIIKDKRYDNIHHTLSFYYEDLILAEYLNAVISDSNNNEYEFIVPKNTLELKNITSLIHHWFIQAFTASADNPEHISVVIKKDNTYLAAITIIRNSKTINKIYGDKYGISDKSELIRIIKIWAETKDLIWPDSDEYLYEFMTE